MALNDKKLLRELQEHLTKLMGVPAEVALPPKSLEDTEYDLYELHELEEMLAEHEDYEEWHGIRVHPRSKCEGQVCTIHNPSDHYAKDWPQHFRLDRGIMERMCPHGVGHPDPDDVTDDTTHGCDGCCK